jgi:hypothetical protein
MLKPVLEPWTRWQGNRNSPLMVVGNEYHDKKTEKGTFVHYRRLPALDIPTNAHIFYFLHLIGIPIPRPPATRAEAKMPKYGKSSLVLFTNTRLYREKKSDLEARLQKYKAVLVVSAGKIAYDKVSKLTMLGPRPKFKKAMGKLKKISAKHSKCGFLYPVLHPSHRNLKAQVDQWKTLGHLIQCDPQLQDVKKWLKQRVRTD